MVWIYKVTSQAEWAIAEAAGVFRGAEIDLRDGYIHLSSGAQVEQTVSLYFRDRDDLVLVAIEGDALGAALKWEPSRGGALFPHLYADLPIWRTAWAAPFSSRREGELAALIARGA